MGQVQEILKEPVQYILYCTFCTNVQLYRLTLSYTMFYSVPEAVVALPKQFFTIV